VITNYGADGLRFTMIYIAPVGLDIRYSNKKCEIGRDFATKMWNVARFRLRYGPLSSGWLDVSPLASQNLRPDDRWMLARASAATAAVTGALERFDFHEVTHFLYEFVWSEFCDWYLESAKAVLNGGAEAERAVRLHVFDHVFSVILRLLHPVMPFITEELYHQLGYVAAADSIMQVAWPESQTTDDLARLGATPETVELVREKFDLVTAVRNVKAGYRIQNRKVDVIVVPADAGREQFLQQDPVALKAFLFADKVEIQRQYNAAGPNAVAVSQLGTAYLPLAGLIEVEAEIARLQKQETELEGWTSGIRQKLANESFVSRAPEAVVMQQRDKLRELTEQCERVRMQLRFLLPV